MKSTNAKNKKEDSVMKLYKIKFNSYVFAILSEEYDVKQFLKGRDPNKYTVEEFEGTLSTLAEVKGVEAE